MITTGAWAGKRYAVLGLARSGRATVDALVAAGAEVVGWDGDEEKRAQYLPGTGRGTAAEGGGGGASAVNDTSAAPPLRQPTAGPPPRAGEVLLADPLTLDLTGFAGVVVSPGVPLNTHPIAAHAARFGVPVIGDIELFAQARAALPAHRVVGITGTNGKSTTTALVAHICRTAGLPTAMAGNIGLPILAQQPLPAGGVYVLELSSYQLDLTATLDCDVAVLLNVTPDHLDRYAGFQAYADSKARLFDMQSDARARVIAIDDAASAAIARHHQNVDRISADGCMDQSRWPALQGPHNAQNALAAMAVARHLGIDAATADRALESFTGLPHRMERVGEKAGVAFVNDSKATNPASTAPALAAFDRIHWILGGQAKTDALDECAPFFGHVAHAYTIGEAGPLFARLLDGRVPVEQARTLDRAVGAAAARAVAGDTVLLSPACASFDQFRDYEARGDAFRDMVGAL